MPGIRGRSARALAADGDDVGLLAELKSDPGQVGLETLLHAIDKLDAVRSIGLPAGLFADASEKLVAAWRARATSSYRSKESILFRLAEAAAEPTTETAGARPKPRKG